MRRLDRLNFPTGSWWSDEYIFSLSAIILWRYRGKNLRFRLRRLYVLYLPADILPNFVWPLDPGMSADMSPSSALKFCMLRLRPTLLEIRIDKRNSWRVGDDNKAGSTLADRANLRPGKLCPSAAAAAAVIPAIAAARSWPWRKVSDATAAAAPTDTRSGGVRCLDPIADIAEWSTSTTGKCCCSASSWSATGTATTYRSGGSNCSGTPASTRA